MDLHGFEDDEDFAFSDGGADRGVEADDAAGHGGEEAFVGGGGARGGDEGVDEGEGPGSVGEEDGEGVVGAGRRGGVAFAV